MSGIDGEGARDIAGRPGGGYMSCGEQCREVRGGVFLLGGGFVGAGSMFISPALFFAFALLEQPRSSLGGGGGSSPVAGLLTAHLHVGAVQLLSLALFCAFTQFS